MTRVFQHIGKRLAAVLVLLALLPLSEHCSAQRFEYYVVDKGTKSAPALQLRTNLLYDIALCPNIGLEVQWQNGLGVQLDYIGAWWYNDGKHRYWNNYGFQTEGRYYFSNGRDRFPLYGHHIGVYGHLVTYDFEFGGTGYSSPKFGDNFGVGASYGYSFRLGDGFHLDCTLGLGYFQSIYGRYVPRNDNYYYIEHRKKTWLGPTKAEVALVWNIFKGNKNAKSKGGYNR